MFVALVSLFLVVMSERHSKKCTELLLSLFLVMVVLEVCIYIYKLKNLLLPNLIFKL